MFSPGDTYFYTRFLICLIFCKGLTPPGLSSFRLSCTFLFSLLRSCLASHVGEMILYGNSLCYYNEIQFSTKLVWLWILKSLSFIFHRDSWAFMWELNHRLSSCAGFHSSTLWLVVVFCVGLCLLQRQFFLMKGKDNPFLRVLRTNVLNVVGNPLVG